MGRVKFSSVNKFKGKRRRSKKVVIQVSKSDLKHTDLPEAGGSSEGDQSRPCPTTSKTAKKFEVFGVNLQPDATKTESNGDEDDFIFVQKSTMKTMLSLLACPKCNNAGTLAYDHTNEGSNGLCVKSSLFCKQCEELVFNDYLCSRVGGSNSLTVPFELNLRAVMAFRGIGCGHSAIKEWCGIMNMPATFSKDSYYGGSNKLFNASGATVDTVMKKSVEHIFESYESVGVVPDEAGVLDIGVSFDGSWHKRGHSSHNGIAVAIDLLTGLPLDFEVLSNFCHKCNLSPAEDDPDYNEWQEQHKSDCQKNYEGSANAMEVECAKRIWSRSVEKHSLRYTTMLSDGDSKSFDAVSKSNNYGPEHPINKEECVNHVSKRMGTALNNLLASSRAQGESLSGRGKLTKEKILKIQNYYGKAIKENVGDSELMKKRIFLILYHLSSNDENPKHFHCPPGERSWCFWQRALAKDETPGGHKEHETIPVDIGKHMVPIFQRLSDKKL